MSRQTSIPRKLISSLPAICWCLCLGLSASSFQSQAQPTPAPVRLIPATSNNLAIVQAARTQIGVTRIYDPAYVVLRYPGGDVKPNRGVCTDVVIRALRQQHLDLQQRVHDDMRANFDEYPQQWGLTAPDRNIDHRRVPNLMRWFDRQAWSQPISTRAADYLPGDIVAWKLNGSGLLHIGIVSDRESANATPLIIHNIGSGTQENDLLFQHSIIGHYRPRF